MHWDSEEMDLGQTRLMTVEEFRNQETSVQDEQLIHLKRPSRNDSDF